MYHLNHLKRKDLLDLKDLNMNLDEQAELVYKNTGENEITSKLPNSRGKFSKMWYNLSNSDIADYVDSHTDLIINTIIESDHLQTRALKIAKEYDQSDYIDKGVLSYTIEYMKALESDSLGCKDYSRNLENILDHVSIIHINTRASDLVLSLFFEVFNRYLYHNDIYDEDILEYSRDVYYICYYVIESKPDINSHFGDYIDNAVAETRIEKVLNDIDYNIMLPNIYYFLVLYCKREDKPFPNVRVIDFLSPNYYKIIPSLSAAYIFDIFFRYSPDKEYADLVREVPIYLEGEVSTDFPYRTQTFELKKRSGYSTVSKIEKGSYGVVYKGEIENKEGDVAIKKYTNENNIKDIIIEISCLYNIDNANIVSLYNIGTNSIVLEYMEQDLHEYLSKNGPLEITHIKDIFSSILIALDYLKRMNIVHGDIKLENILYKDGVAKLGDFGMSTIFSNSGIKKETPVYSLGYIPIEILMGYDYNFKADLWALGIGMLKLFTGKKLFSFKSEKMIILGNINPDFIGELESVLALTGTDNIVGLNQHVKVITKREENSIPFVMSYYHHITQTYDPDFLDLLDNLICVPQVRFDAWEALNHRFF